MEIPCRRFTFRQFRSSQPDSFMFDEGHFGNSAARTYRCLPAIRYVDKRIQRYVIYYDNLVLSSHLMLTTHPKRKRGYSALPKLYSDSRSAFPRLHYARCRSHFDCLPDLARELECSSPTSLPSSGLFLFKNGTINRSLRILHEVSLILFITISIVFWCMLCNEGRRLATKVRRRYSR